MLCVALGMQKPAWKKPGNGPERPHSSSGFRLGAFLAETGDASAERTASHSEEAARTPRVRIMTPLSIWIQAKAGTCRWSFFLRGVGTAVKSLWWMVPLKLPSTATSVPPGGQRGPLPPE